MSRRRLAEKQLLQMIGQEMAGGEGPCAQCLPRELSPVKPAAGGANWQLLAQDLPCPPGCEEKLLEVCRDLAAHYDVDWP